MQQSCSQKTRKRCFQQRLSSHQCTAGQGPQGMAVTQPVGIGGCREQTPFPSRQAVPGGGGPCARRRQPSRPPRPAAACCHRRAVGEEAGHPAEPLPQDDGAFYRVSLHCSRGQQTRSALSPLPAHMPALGLSFPTSQHPPCKAPSGLLASWGY